MRQADALMARLQDALLAAELTKGELDALAAGRKLQLIVVMTLGSTLLLAANLMSEKPPPQAETPTSSDEVAAAGRLIELAMRELKALGDGKSAEMGEAPATPETKAPASRSINRRRDRRGLDGPAESGGGHRDLLAGPHAPDVDAPSDLVGRAVVQCDDMLHQVDGLDSSSRHVRRFRRKRSCSRTENCRGDRHIEHLTHRYDLSFLNGPLAGNLKHPFVAV